MNPDLLNCDPQGRTRIRFSLMPQAMTKVVDIRTSPVSSRIKAINDFVSAGYEVHANFSPVIVHEGWEAEWRDLFCEIDDILTPQAKAQLKCEIIMLTHNAALHEVNMAWHPKGEDKLWRPDLQEEKVSEGGMVNLRYPARWKRRWLDQLLIWLEGTIPYCEVRYAF